MGAKHTSNYSAEALKTFAKDYTLERTLDDARYGRAQVYKHKTDGNKVLVSNKVFPSKEELTTFTETVQSRLENFSHPNLVSILGYSEVANKNLCSEMNQFSLYFEYLRRDLASEILSRAEKQEYFSEEEAWYLVNSLLSAVDYLQTRGLAHGAIHPRNVLINDEGEVKLYDTGLLSAQSVQSKALNKQGFLAPEELEAAENPELAYSQHDADLYAVGLTLLQILTLRDVETLVYEDNKVSNNGVGELCFQAKRRYSPAIVDLAMRLLSQQPGNRIGLNNAFNTIRTSVSVRPLVQGTLTASQLQRVISGEEKKEEVVVE